MHSNCRFFIALVPGLVILQGCVKPMPNHYAKILVVVQDLSNRLEKYDVDRRGIADCLEGHLSGNGYSVVEREALEQVLEQIHLSGSGITEGKASELGKMLDAEAILLTNVTEAKVTALEFSIGPIPIPIDFGQRSDTDQYKATVRLSARLIDVQKSQVVWAHSAKSLWFVPSKDDLGDAHLLAANMLARDFRDYESKLASGGTSTSSLPE